MSTDEDGERVTLDRATWRAAIDRADGDPPDPVSVADVLADADLAPVADLTAAQRAVYAALDGDGPLEDVDAGAYGGVALADAPGDGRASGTCGARERDDDAPSADSPGETADAPDPDGAPDAERGDVDAGGSRAPALEAFADAIDYFHAQLDRDLPEDTDTPREYYEEHRRLEPDTVAAKRLGYAPDDAHGLLDHLMRRGHDRVSDGDDDRLRADGGRRIPSTQEVADEIGADPDQLRSFLKTHPHASPGYVLTSFGAELRYSDLIENWIKDVRREQLRRTGGDEP